MFSAQLAKVFSDFYLNRFFCAWRLCCLDWIYCQTNDCSHCDSISKWSISIRLQFFRGLGSLDSLCCGCNFDILFQTQ